VARNGELPAWAGKLDPRLRLLVDRSSATCERGTLAVLVLLDGDIGQLTAAGFRVGQHAGRTATVEVEVADLPRLAAHPAVAYVESAPSWHPDRDGRS
jgi:hypothetical protein